MKKPTTENSAVLRAAAAPGRQPTGYSAMLVSEHNACLQTISLAAPRVQELPVELNQFFAAALANRSRLNFDIEPASFVVSLSCQAKNRE